MPIPADQPPKAHIVTALLRDGDRVLLCHRSPRKQHHPNVWGAAGGHVDPGELPADALVREVREELGIDITAPTTPPALEIHGEALHLQLWLIDEWTGTPINAAPEEHDTIAWFTRGDLTDLPITHGSLLATFIRRTLATHQPG